MKSVLRDIFSVFKSKVAIILFNLLKTIIIARVLGPEINGELSAILVYPALFLTFGSLGIRKSSAYFIGTEKYEETSIFHSIIHFWGLSSILSVVLTFLFMFFLMSETPPMNYLIFAILPLPFTLLNNYLSGVFLGKNQIKEFNEINWLPALITFIFTFIFLIVFDFKLIGALWANLLGASFMSVVLLFKLGFRNLFSLSVHPKIIMDIGKLGLAFAASLLLINLNYQVDILLMELLTTKYEIGIYGKGAVLTQYLWQIPMLLGTIVFARGTRARDKNLFSQKVSQLLRLSLIFMVIGGVFLALFSKYVVLLLFGESFVPSSQIVLWLLPGVIFLTIFKVLHMDISSQGKPLFVFKSMGPALIVNVVLNIVTIPKYGAEGAALSSTISYTFGGLLYLVQYSSFTKLSIPKILKYQSADLEVIYSILEHLKIKRIS